NKLATLVKDIKTLVSDGPLSVPAYQPQWPSAHGVVLKKRSKANFENDSISDVFRHRTMSWLQDTRVPHTATEADSLQIPREDQAENKFAGLKFDLTDLDFEAVAGFPEILIHPDATVQFLLQKDEEESLVDTAAVEAKTADRREPSSVTQSQY
ncbi:MAG TPA: hypothetical protein VKA94_11910, partial [Hyphomicrobiales bacterium]|nr:hypothetical protein [Hyphomicrobiales bacterium]